MKKFRIPDQISASRALIAVTSMIIFQSLESFSSKCFAVIFWVLSLIADSLDGYVARRLHIQSENGALIDILADRITETCAWTVVIASLDHVFLVTAILIIAARNLLTDFAKVTIIVRGEKSIGGVPEMEGFQNTIVRDPRSRAGYNALKAVVIISLLLTIVARLELNLLQAVLLCLLACYSLLRASGSVVHCKFPMRLSRKQIPWSVRGLLCIDMLFLIIVIMRFLF